MDFYKGLLVLIDRGGDWKKKCHYDSSDKLKTGKESYFLSIHIRLVYQQTIYIRLEVGGGLEAEYNPCHKLQSNQTPMWTFNNIEILIYSMLICPFRNMSPCCWYWVLISDCCGTNTRAPLCPVDGHILAEYWLSSTFWQGIGYRWGGSPCHMLAYSIVIIISV